MAKPTPRIGNIITADSAIQDIFSSKLSVLGLISSVTLRKESGYKTQLPNFFIVFDGRLDAPAEEDLSYIVKFEILAPDGTSGLIKEFPSAKIAKGFDGFRLIFNVSNFIFDKEGVYSARIFVDGEKVREEHLLLRAKKED